MIADTIHTVSFDLSDDGWLMTLCGTDDDYHFNVHVVSHELLAEAQGELGPWVAQEIAEYNNRKRLKGDVEDDEDYELSRRDPSHPHHLSLVVSNE